MENLKPNSQRAKIAIAFVWTVMAIEICMLISEYFQYNLLKAIEAGDFIEEGAAEINDLRQQALSIIYLVAFITSTVTFIMWFRRAYFNLHTRVSNLRYAEGWAAGGWFVPIISLYYPYQIMKELYLETENILCKNIENYTAKTKVTFVGWWWTLWIINNVLGQIVFRVSRNADTVDQLINSTEISMISNVFGIPLAIITVKVIKDYSSIEPLLFELKNEEVKKEEVPQRQSTIQ